MIKFIYGSSSEEKTKLLTEMIAKDAESAKLSILLVPEQFAVQTERRMLKELKPKAQLTLEVLNFSRLYNRVCREYGGLKYNYITPPLRYVMMWQNLRERAANLNVWNEYAEGDRALADLMLSAYDDIRASGITPEKLEEVAKELPKDSTLSKKLKDLSTVASTFSLAVSRAFSDAADDISKLCDILSEYAFFKGKNVYLDSFTSFTAAEYGVIEKIFAQSDNVTVTVPLDFPQMNTVYTGSICDAEKTLRRLAKDHGGYKSEICKGDDAKHVDISLLTEDLWLPAATEEKCKDSDGVFMLKCSSPYAEADAAAATVLSLLREGYRCRDIVVIMRNADNYRGIIEPAFERCGVPFYFSEKTSLANTPIVQFLISALRVGIYGWRTTDVISHLKCSLYGIDRTELDLFEQYVTTWQVRGKSFCAGDFDMNPDGYASELSDRGRTILRGANKVRKKLCDSLVPLFSDIENEKTLAGKCRAIFRFLDGSGAQKYLEALSEKEKSRGNVRASEEYERLFPLFCDSLASLAEAMDANEFAEDLSLSSLCELLTLYFSKTDMGSIPTSADQVIIGSASMLRAGAPKCALILGLCEGVFPAPVNESGLLSFAEKEMLEKHKLKLSRSVSFAASDELMYVQRALETPSKRLYLFTYTNATDGRKSTPSLPFLRAKKMFPERLTVYDSHDIIALTPSLRAALPYINELRGTNEGELLLELANKDEELYPLLRGYDIPVSDLECTVSKESVELVFGKELKLSQSKIDKFVNCGFSYYCAYGLSLREEQISRFKANDIGTFIHFILEKLLSKLVTENGIDADLSHEELEYMTRETVKDYIELIRPKNTPITARLGHLFDRLCNLSLLLVKHSSFRPEFFELDTDGKENRPSPREFVLNDGTHVVFSGVIDRVDILRQDDGKVYIRVVDYKTGTKEFSLEDIKHGLNIQMLLYLFTLIKNQNGEFNALIGTTEPCEAGVVYLSSNAPIPDIPDFKSSDEVFEVAQKELKRSGLFLDDKEILRAMNDELSPDFLGGISERKSDGVMTTGKTKRSTLASEKLFETLSEEIDRSIVRISEKMMSGKADADPLIYKKKNPCTYCAMKPICRKKSK